jgi:sorbitol/mannitol transport system permease protein
MPAAAALIWKYSLLEVNTGMINWGLGLIGIDPIAWNTDYPAMTIVFTLTWQYTPFMMLILLAGLQSQSGEVLEAADVDGASTVQTFRFMTLPHLRTYAELAILLGTVFMIQVFDPVNIMTKGAGNTKTIAYLLYERAFIGQQIGEAAAYGVITVIVTIVIATAALRTMFKIFTEEAR